MKKILLRQGIWSVLIVIGLTSANLLSAQTDVTNTYIENAGFNTNCNYSTGANETVVTADPGNLKTVENWTVSSAPAWSAGGTFEYGWSGSFNGETIPTSDNNGATGSGHGTLGLSAGWSGIIGYHQQITLPSGKYKLIYEMYFKGNNSINANKTGWDSE